MKRTILLIIIVGWLLIPTGTPDDILTLWIIKKLGFQMYALLLIVLFAVMLHYKINFEKVKKGIKQIFHKK